MLPFSLGSLKEIHSTKYYSVAHSASRVPGLTFGRVALAVLIGWLHCRRSGWCGEETWTLLLVGMVRLSPSCFAAILQTLQTRGRLQVACSSKDIGRASDIARCELQPQKAQKQIVDPSNCLVASV
jgi:hypothetical protein